MLCDNRAELDRYWSAPPRARRRTAGRLIDRFGLRRQIDPAMLDEMRTTDAARSKRVTDRMPNMPCAALQGTLEKGVTMISCCGLTTPCTTGWPPDAVESGLE